MTTLPTTIHEDSRKEELHQWIIRKYAEKHLEELKKQHDAVWIAAELTLKDDLRTTCDYLIKQQEKTKATKVYITFRLQCQSAVIFGDTQLPRSDEAFESKTAEHHSFKHAWADFEDFVKNCYIQVTPSKEWQNWVHSTFDHPVRGNGKFPFESKMPDWFHNNKDCKYDCYIEYETHIVGVN